MDERVKEAVLFMEGNCQRKLRLRQIAAVVGLSPSRLSALFLTDLEVSPMRHVKTLRMQQAKALLLSSTLSVKEIAAHVGFNDISHFIRDFSSLYGQAPTTIRMSGSSPRLPISTARHFLATWIPNPNVHGKRGFVVKLKINAPAEIRGLARPGPRGDM